MNLLHVARLWLEGRSTLADQPVLEWTRGDRFVWVPLHDGRVFCVELRNPAAFAQVCGAFAVAVCGGPEIVRARAAVAGHSEPRPMRARARAGTDDKVLLDPALRRGKVENRVHIDRDAEGSWLRS